MVGSCGATPPASKKITRLGASVRCASMAAAHGTPPLSLWLVGIAGAIGCNLGSVVAYFVGPSAPAAKARSLASSGISGARRKAGDLGYRSSPLEVFVAAHRHGLELTVAGLALLVLVLWNHPGIGTVLAIAIVAGIVVGFIEFLSRGATPEPAEEQTSA